MVTIARSFLAALISCATAAGCGGDGSSGDMAPTVTLLSSRTEAVSNESALVQVSVPAGVDVAAVKVVLGSTDVTSQFKPNSDTTLVGLVSGLQPGQNNIVASVGTASATLQVTDTNKSGPIFSGPQQFPWLCTTDKWVLPDGSNLGPPTDAYCNAPTKVLYLYMPVGGTALRVLPSTTHLPADLSKTTTNDGRTVNYIVRLETGTVNRGIYQIAVLFDPSTDKVPNPGGAFSAWNGKLIYTFGGGLGPGYAQATLAATGGVTSDFMLSKGFAVASSTLNVGLNYFNDVVSAETTSMVKEIFIKEFGVPLYTMGWGGSGGSMQQQLIANNYPGLLDGINPSLTFPDLLTVIPNAHDCALLDRAFNASSVPWTTEQKGAVAGFASWGNCNAGANTIFATDWLHSYSLLLAKRFVTDAIGAFTSCGAVIPDSWIYDPVTNRGGARCGIYDAEKTLLGIDPKTGFARRPLDNFGVQYGLKALAAGKISVEQFIQLNEFAGGFDGDGNLQSARTEATMDVLTAAYAYGRVNQFQNLNNVAIIDYRAYSEFHPNIHMFGYSYVSRARLVKATGSAANQVIWAAPESAPTPGPTPPLPVINQVISNMDQWLTALKKDSGAGTLAEKVVRNKPSSLTDGCFTSANQFISQPMSVDNNGQCGTLYPAYADPRTAAGGPLTGDVLKCQLRPLARDGYSGITDAQLARLTAVFPAGVCDYNKPGLGAVPLVGTWLKYTAPGVASPI